MFNEISNFWDDWKWIVCSLQLKLDPDIDALVPQVKSWILWFYLCPVNANLESFVLLNLDLILQRFPVLATLLNKNTIQFMSHKSPADDLRLNSSWLLDVKPVNPGKYDFFLSSFILPSTIKGKTDSSFNTLYELNFRLE